jgi:PIN domain nuclease of toxin-antitoxin system
MHVLLDTHALIWHFEDSDSLSRYAKGIINTRQNRLYISAVSIWELSIKVSRGKLQLASSVRAMIGSYIAIGATLLSMTPEHAMAVQTLPWHHRDPFDRMLITQARHEGLTLLTHDEMIRQYDVQHIW